MENQANGSKEKVSYRADACDAFLCITMNTFYPHLCKNSTEHFCYTNAEGPRPKPPALFPFDDANVFLLLSTNLNVNILAKNR